MTNLRIAAGDPAPDLERVLNASFASCRRHYDKRLTLERVLVHVIEDDGARAILNDCMPAGKVAALHGNMRTVVADQLAARANALKWPSGGPSGLRARLAQYMTIGAAKLDNLLERTISPGEHLQHAMLEATVRAINMASPVDLRVLLFAIVRHRIGLAASALEEHGLDRYRLACRIAHGAATEDAERDHAFAPGSDEARLVIFNDDYTPMLFVVEVLESVLAMPPAQAQACMMQIHQEGQADCGVFPLAIARAKLDDVLALARDRCEPLRAGLASA
ncbi:ATP-dependent Clp protease adaptor ClpS [Massilia pseudoviolaceinigra]|uniref:ATP-dependent Clp protease adaptor ClpS n=1 Tax=Massilia pseudoviolaceinigra TaxID=3057165 RepID=UPI002796BAD3|nr:ATP-dependent Clp protease adaptor ClpS [Massilia sp. CCM 9206]MDQ1923553.1 ATP-dependent Clp protease adaptor ClpS [Massilia sp. CCM 9206]